MTLECAHCGARFPGSVKRCPQCLRTTGLLEIEAAPKASGAATARRAVVPIMCAILGAAAVGFWFVRNREPHRSASDRPAIDTHEVPTAVAASPAIAAWVAQVRPAGDPLAQARLALDLVSGALRSSGARRVTDVDDVPPARGIDAIAAAVRTPDGRVTTLDLARLIASILLGCDTHAQIVEQTLSLRVDEPADPSGVLGRYAAIVRDHGADLPSGTLVAARELRPTILDEHALAGAMLSQTALARAVAGDGASAVSLADSALRQWPDSPVVLAARAVVLRLIGASGGLRLARQDVSAALAQRDTAPLHVLRARIAVADGDLGALAADASAALRLAPHWAPAGLLAVVAGVGERDGGGPCDPLASAREAWATDAMLLCAHREAPDELTRAAAQRLMLSSREPLRVAFAAAGDAEGAGARVSVSEKPELAAWLTLLGRRDLALRVLGLGPDAGR